MKLFGKVSVNLVALVVKSINQDEARSLLLVQNVREILANLVYSVSSGEVGVFGNVMQCFVNKEVAAKIDAFLNARLFEGVLVVSV